MNSLMQISHSQFWIPYVEYDMMISPTNTVTMAKFHWFLFQTTIIAKEGSQLWTDWVWRNRIYCANRKFCKKGLFCSQKCESNSIGDSCWGSLDVGRYGRISGSANWIGERVSLKNVENYKGIRYKPIEISSHPVWNWMKM